MSEILVPTQVLERKAGELVITGYGFTDGSTFDTMTSKNTGALLVEFFVDCEGRKIDAPGVNPSFESFSTMVSSFPAER